MSDCAGQLSMFDEGHARSGDPGTSWDAARSLHSLTERRSAVLELLRRLGPSADHEIAVAYALAEAEGLVPLQSPSGLRTRRSELVTLGLVVDTGHTMRTASGRQSIVWEAA